MEGMEKKGEENEREHRILVRGWFLSEGERGEYDGRCVIGLMERKESLVLREESVEELYGEK
ncbi:hypothetical protein, partial [Paenibacillus xylanexedens]|uniref:hypothetical protein n=1 Tax=Paenibacillus xylanexedens TaxID=528191 RepID=UPI001C92D945